MVMLLVKEWLNSADTVTPLELLPVVLIRLEVRGDDHSVRELPAGEGLLRLLAAGNVGKLDKDLAAARNLDSRKRTGDLDGAHPAELAALLEHVLEDVLILLLVDQLLGLHHVEEAQHLRLLPGSLHAGCRVHGGHVLGADARPLHDELLVTELHAIETGNGLVGDGDIDELAEGVGLGDAHGRVLDQVEGPQLPAGG